MTTAPNVLVHVTHDLGRLVGPAGVPTVRTPHLDRLAREGAVMPNHFASAPQCSPSRAGLFTGRAPHSTGVLGLTGAAFGWTLNPDERHLARILGEAGYQTVLCGIAHEAAGNGCPASQLDVCGFEDRSRHGQLPPGEAGASFRDFLARSRDPSRPFYVQFGTGKCHNRPDFPRDENRPATVPEPLHDGPATRRQMAAYHDCVEAFDEGLGDVLEALDEHRLAENTLVVATTDHGLNVPRAKTSLYDPGLASYFVARFPGRIAAGARPEALVSNVDVLPTVLDAVGLPPEPRAQGVSFFPQLRGEEGAPREAVFGEKTYHSVYDPMRCVRTRHYKLIYNLDAIAPHEHFPGGPGDPVYWENLHLYAGARLKRTQATELYDLEHDPHELHNRADDPEYAGVRAELEGRLGAWMEETRDPLLEGPVAAPAFYHRIDAIRRAARRHRGTEREATP